MLSKQYPFISHSLLVLLLTTLVACGGGGEGDQLPNEIIISKVPEQSVYGANSPVTIQTTVLDKNGNILNGVSVELTSNPPASQQNGNQFIFQTEDIYTVTATVLGETEGGNPVTDSVEIAVDATGPLVSCDNPMNGAILSQAPGGVQVDGMVSDLSAGIDQFFVNDMPVSVDPGGVFSALITAGWGINFVNLRAIDAVGNETRKTCSFLLSEYWVPDDQVQAGTVSVALRQAAIDDSSRSGAMNSVGDVIHAVINSSALRDELHSSLLAQSSLKPDSCDQSVLGVCVLRSEVLYLDIQIPGPNSSSLNLVSGGIRNQSRVENLRIRIRVRGHVAGIPYDTTGWITFSYGAVDTIYDTTFSAGNLQVSSRPGSASVSMGSISTSFSGLDGAIVDIVVDLFNGTVRNLVAGLVRDFVGNDLSDILDSLLGELDINNIASAYNVVRLDGIGQVPVNFSTSLTGLNTSPARMYLQLGTKFQSTPAHAKPTLGAPVMTNAPGLDIPGSAAMKGAVHTNVFNQAFHALWRGGYFDADFSEGDLGGLIPPGVELYINTLIPPAVQLLDNNRLEVSLGAINVSLTYPALFPGTQNFDLGARGSCAISLSSQDLLLQDCTLDELHLSGGDGVLDAQTRTDLEQFISSVINDIFITSLDDVLPAFPIPSIPVPVGFEPFGFPPGSEFMMINPVMIIQPQHIILEGDFGLQ